MPAGATPRAPLNDSHHRLSLARIRSALTEIDPIFLGMPQFRAPGLSRRLGCDILIKDETANALRCFKGRGADCLLVRLAACDGPQTLVCASAGNFGLAMANACQRHGRIATVFVSRHASAARIGQIRRHGARVLVDGDDFDEAKAAARAYTHSRSLCYIEDGNEVAISEGAGTIALELLDDLAPLDAVVLPLGNGALLAGVSRVMQANSPTTLNIGVCSTRAPVMHDCWKHGGIPGTSPVTRVDTIADGIAVRIPVASAVDDLVGLVDDVLLVDDYRLLEAMRWIHEDTGLLVEPSAAAGIAAIAEHPSRFAGMRVATALTGANPGNEQIASLLD